jgi:pantoate--beta-alanine ligase
VRVASIADLRGILSQHRAAGKTISFVPTMGALHDGHRSCIEIAGKHGDILLVSIYVNPAQFGPGEDYEKYPRNLEADVELCRRLSCDIVFTPEDREMYPVPQNAWVTVDGLTQPLCGRNRPGHFRGVTTVVAKLFNIVNPDVAVFGQKDAQQALVIREMVRRLDFPVRLILSPTIREADGLAVSSRNKYLSGAERGKAAAVHQSLQAGRKLLETGERDAVAVTRCVTDHLLANGIDHIEYAELLAADDLSQLNQVRGKVILAVAIKLGKTRLIDNIVLTVEDAGPVEEAMLFS